MGGIDMSEIRLDLTGKFRTGKKSNERVIPIFLSQIFLSNTLEMMLAYFAFSFERIHRSPVCRNLVQCLDWRFPNQHTITRRPHAFYPSFPFDSDPLSNDCQCGKLAAMARSKKRWNFHRKKHSNEVDSIREYCMAHADARPSGCNTLHLG